MKARAAVTAAHHTLKAAKDTAAAHPSPAADTAVTAAEIALLSAEISETRLRKATKGTVTGMRHLAKALDAAQGRGDRIGARRLQQELTALQAERAQQLAEYHASRDTGTVSRTDAAIDQDRAGFHPAYGWDYHSQNLLGEGAKLSSDVQASLLYAQQHGDTASIGSGEHALLRAIGAHNDRNTAVTWTPHIGAIGPDSPPAAVKVIETALGRTAPTGAYDTTVRTAVAAFQSDHGLTADGIVGRDTWNALQVTTADLRGQFGYTATDDTPTAAANTRTPRVVVVDDVPQRRVLWDEDSNAVNLDRIMHNDQLDTAFERAFAGARTS